MESYESLGFKYDGQQITVLDQQRLPHSEQWIDVTEVSEMINAIKRLQVRGAPMIGVAASFCLAHLAKKKGMTLGDWLLESEELYLSRPTAVNLMHCIDRMREHVKAHSLDKAMDMADKIFTEDQHLCESIANAGTSLVSEGMRILTYCNTGGLATVGTGTAIGIIKKSYEVHSNIHVYVPETRPLLQGGRLTAWEMAKFNIPHTLICDNMCAHLMSIGEIDMVIVGADRIAKNGDFANKIGTLQLAILAKYHNIPFYVAAPSTTVDLNCNHGQAIPIELRNGNEVKGVKTEYGEVYWSPDNSPTYNPAFDVTPNELVSAWIVDNRVLSHFETEY